MEERAVDIQRVRSVKIVPCVETSRVAHDEVRIQSSIRRESEQQARSIPYGLCVKRVFVGQEYKMRMPSALYCRVF